VSDDAEVGVVGEGRLEFGRDGDFYLIGIGEERRDVPLKKGTGTLVVGWVLESWLGAVIVMTSGRGGVASSH
jgi:hypothetical protein